MSIAGLIPTFPIFPGCAFDDGTMTTGLEAFTLITEQNSSLLPRKAQTRIPLVAHRAS